jgi:uncharacterized protein (DUF1684 family)
MLIALLGASASGCSGTDPEAYAEEIERYRSGRLERLQADDGWLTVIGLDWLESGVNSFGSASENPIVFPEDASPPVAGSFLYQDGRILLRADASAGITLDGGAITEFELAEPGSGEPQIFKLGRLQFYLIKRGERYAIRTKDPRSTMRTEFAGLEYFPIDPMAKITARLLPFEAAREVEIETVIGTAATYVLPGELEFELYGKSFRLAPLISDPSDTSLFLIFKDATSGTETYGAGRYLYAELDGDTAVIDFNKAYNPPCAFTRFATCPLPPAQNRLDVRIEVGEKAYSGHPPTH